MWASEKWKDYECIDTCGGMKLERWGNVILSRPDPQIIWNKKGDEAAWKRADAVYNRSSSGGGAWKYNGRVPDKWVVSYGDLKFNVKTMGFKHTGIFPEQAVNWDYIAQKLKDRPKAKVLNLFAYTGAATMAASAAGSDVCHVDAAKGMVAWAKENAEISGLSGNYIRYIVDDCMKFVEREIRRGKKYDAIIMDPPSYGRGSTGEVWKLEECLWGFVERCAMLLSDDPIFFLINSYTTGLAPTVMKNILKLALPEGKVEADEIGVKVTSSGIYLPCGATARWEA
ncbi:MAG: class I SAM-dependent methyltransferase [Clostridia bacterium]|nr:class I SAM-dependent methyltransferase [Clostridia bacterium]